MTTVTVPAGFRFSLAFGMTTSIVRCREVSEPRPYSPADTGIYCLVPYAIIRGITMPDLPRREFLTNAAAFAAGVTAALTGSGRATGGDPHFMNNVPDPLISGKELPTFKFALEKSEGKVIGKNSAKEATVLQLPISKGIAGVSMRLGRADARTALARNGGRMGVRGHGPGADHGPRARRLCRD